jgi:hypothetical protein
MKGGKLKGLSHPPKNKILLMKLIKIMCEYSERKNKAKVILEYSVLYPDTNSDSKNFTLILYWSKPVSFIIFFFIHRKMAPDGVRASSEWKLWLARASTQKERNIQDPNLNIFLPFVR